jgi:hypothetical protein
VWVRRSRPIGRLGALLLVQALALACTDPEQAFESARVEDDVAAYERYIRDFPDSPQVELAWQRIELIRAFEAAEAQGSAGAYEEFAARFPESGRAEIAARRARELRTDAWQAALREGGVDALASFREAFPESPEATLALDRMRVIAIQAKLAESASATDLNAVELAEVHRTGRLPPGLDPQLGELAIAALAHAATALRGEGSFSIAAIQCHPQAPHRLKLGGGKAQGEIETRNPDGGEAYVARLSELATDAEGALVMLGTGELLLGASFSTQQEAGYTSPIVGSLGVAQIEAGDYVLSAELPSDRLAFQPRVGIGTSFLLPAGAGTTFRFRGEVDGFFEGWRFEGSSEHPLVFALIENVGLVHLSGVGSVYSGGELLLRVPEAGASHDAAGPDA